MMYIGLDLGTSGLKGILIGGDQAVLAEATAPLTVQRPHEGWSEQAPSDWISAAETVFDRLAAQKPLGGVRGIGLSGHMHGATLLDARDEVLRPCILWNDTRSHEEAAELDGDPMFRRLTGNIVFPGFTAPKLLWVRAHEPEIYAQARHVLLPKDYIRLRLSGDYAMDCADGSGTMLFDLGRPWNIWHPLVMWNPRSVMFEVGWCVTLYTTVLALEFSGMVFERLGWNKALVIQQTATLPLVCLLYTSDAADE